MSKSSLELKFGIEEIIRTDISLAESGQEIPKPYQSVKEWESEPSFIACYEHIKAHLFDPFYNAAFQDLNSFVIESSCWSLTQEILINGREIAG